MKAFLVEMRGDVREVYYVEAETAEEARENWYEGDLEISEASSMKFASVREDN